MEPQESANPGELFFLVFYLLLPILMLIGSWLVHFFIRHSQEKYLRTEEQRLNGAIRLNNLRRFAAGGCAEPQLVTGSAVIANNYFVAFVANFKHLLGGELKGYTQMCTLARRLALVRLLQEAERLGANAVYNVRFETATILAANNRKATGGVELIAYGTAVKEQPL